MRERRRATGNLPVRTGLPEWTAAAGEPIPPGRLRRRRRWTAAPPSRVPRRRLPSRLWKEKERTRIRSGPNEVGFRSGAGKGEERSGWASFQSGPGLNEQLFRVGSVFKPDQANPGGMGFIQGRSGPNRTRPKVDGVTPKPVGSEKVIWVIGRIMREEYN